MIVRQGRGPGFLVSRGARFCFVSTALLIAGCAVGPDFKKPAAPAVSSYTTTPVVTTAATPGVAGGEAQRFINGGDISSDWWTLFHSEALNALIDESLRNNADLKAAQAALFGRGWARV